MHQFEYTNIVYRKANNSKCGYVSHYKRGNQCEALVLQRARRYGMSAAKPAETNASKPLVVRGDTK
jgi:hypothetical protein